MIKDKKAAFPRPDLCREQWMSLNGNWSFAFDDNKQGIAEKWYEEHEYDMCIQVPFCYQSRMSGIHDKGKHFHLWYERTVEITDSMKGQKLWLHFGAVDYEAAIWINGSYAGGHTGGFSSHSYDITNLVDFSKPQFKITVYCRDDDSIIKPRGKQHWEEETDRCWYTATSGIWQNVWLEMTPGYRMENIKITPDIDQKTVSVDFRFSDKPMRGELEWSLRFRGRELKNGILSLNKEREKLVFSVENADPIDNRMYLWEPGSPNLYDLELSVYENGKLQDKIITYFGMRKIERRGEHIYLNHYPLYQKLILDQGYWQDSLMTPPSEEALLKDLMLAKEMGFNGVRKHQKIEDPRFLYFADTLGMLVWEEMPSMYEFGEESMQAFTAEYMQIMERDYNHPSIITWVPFNESWGIRDVLWDERQQNFAKSMYHLTKAWDATRLVSTNDGWESLPAELIGIHDYEDDGEKFYKTYEDKEKILNYTAVGKMICSQAFSYNGEPVLISEFGGIAMEDGLEKSWGYHEKAADAGIWKEKIKGLVAAIRKLPYVEGYCYTQLTDVEQETNGLLYGDRTPKIAMEELKEIFSC